MVFHTPSLQSTYHHRYWQVVWMKADFVLFHDVFHHLQEHQSHQVWSTLLLQLLVDLCLWAFRKVVFQVLVEC